MMDELKLWSQATIAANGIVVVCGLIAPYQTSKAHEVLSHRKFCLWSWRRGKQFHQESAIQNTSVGF